MRRFRMSKFDTSKLFGVYHHGSWQSQNQIRPYIFEVKYQYDFQIKWYDEEHPEGVCVEEFVQEGAVCFADVGLKYNAKASALQCKITFGTRQVFVLPVQCQGTRTLQAYDGFILWYKFRNTSYNSPNPS